jgi:hypothetical protein
MIVPTDTKTTAMIDNMIFRLGGKYNLYTTGSSKSASFPGVDPDSCAYNNLYEIMMPVTRHFSVRVTSFWFPHRAFCVTGNARLPISGRKSAAR